MDYKGIGQRIRKYRKLAHLTQEKLAEIVDISVTHMSHIETADTQLSLPVITHIAAALGVTVDTLLYGTPIEDDTSALHEIAAAMAGCTPAQEKIITALVKTTRQALDLYAKETNESRR